MEEGRSSECSLNGPHTLCITWLVVLSYHMYHIRRMLQEVTTYYDVLDPTIDFLIARRFFIHWLVISCFSQPVEVRKFYTLSRERITEKPAQTNIMVLCSTSASLFLYTTTYSRDRGSQSVQKKEQKRT